MPWFSARMGVWASSYVPDIRKHEQWILICTSWKVVLRQSLCEFSPYKLKQKLLTIQLNWSSEVELHTDGLLEETNAHASKTDTFTISNSLRMHTSRLPRLERLRWNSAGANQLNENSTHCTRTYTFLFISLLPNLILPLNVRVPTNQIRTVPAALIRTGFSLLPKFEFTAKWEDANQSNESSTCAHVHAAPKFDCGVKDHIVVPLVYTLLCCRVREGEKIGGGE